MGGAGRRTRNQAKTGKTGRAEDGAQRNVAGEREDHDKDADGGQRGPGRGDKKDAKAGGHAFAAAETQPEVNMWPRTAKRAASAWASRIEAERGQEADERAAAQPDRGAALEHVEKKRGRAQAFAAGAQHIGGANVAAAHGADVLAAEDAHQQVSRGDGPEQISGGRDGDARKEHNERV